MVREWLALALLSTMLAGCVGGADPGLVEDTGPDASQPTIDVDPEIPTGSIDGQVLDDEGLPVGNASVRLIGLNASAVSAGDGSFGFAKINVGNYAMAASRSGYKGTQFGLEVASGQTTTVTIVLERIPPPVAIIDDSHRFDGYVSVAACYNVAAASTNECRIGSSGTAIPETHRTVSQGSFTLDGPWQTIHLQMEWTPWANTFPNMRLEMVGMQKNDVGCSYSRVLMSATGPSPLVLRLDRDDFDQMMADDETICNLGDSARIFFRGEPAAGSATAVVFVEQRFAVHGAFAYVTPMPEDWQRDTE